MTSALRLTSKDYNPHLIMAAKLLFIPQQEHQADLKARALHKCQIQKYSQNKVKIHQDLAADGSHQQICERQPRKTS